MSDIKISFSKLQTLSNCQYEYKYRYIDKEKVLEIFIQK